MSAPSQRKTPHTQQSISQRVHDETEVKRNTLPPQFEIQDELEHRTRVRLLRRAEVERLTGLSRSTLYSWMKEGRFPQPVRLGARIVAWRESDVTEWLESRQTRVA
jgi:prophage regulatory protein